MSVDLVLRDAKIYVYGRIIDAGLAIDGKRIVRVAKESNLPRASEKINLDGLLVLPGVIDAHVHLRDQELFYKEDFYSGTCAAANGGVTLVVDMPNNKPVTMSCEALRDRMNIASRRTVVNLAFYSAFPKEIDEIKCIVKEGAKAFKTFLSHRIGGISPSNKEALTKACREAAENGVPIAVHAEDGALLNEKIKELRLSGRDDFRAYLEAHSPRTEILGIRRAIKLAKESGAHTHICHVSVSDGLKVILEAKRRGLSISCEVTPHHLLLSSQHLEKIGNIALTNPPLRSSADIIYLRKALQNGLIDMVASDHAPHALKEKESSSVWDVSAGIAGLETTLPLMLTMVNKGQLSLSTLIKAMMENPAKIFRFKRRGFISEGYYADLVVIDMKKEWIIDPSEFYSKAKFSPFEGWHVRGKPVKTFVNGMLVMDDGEIIGKPGDGEIIRR